MNDSPSHLVIGGDSLVGGGLVAALGRRGVPCAATTRRRENLGAGRVLLDFEDEGTYRVPTGFTYAYVVAAATNYERCEKDPAARKINVDLIPRLVESLLAQGLIVAFVSTNSVFGGDRAWPREDDVRSPQIPYARQKSEAENRIWAAADRLAAQARTAIVRLTKILGPQTPPLPAWLAAWDRGQPVEPFADLIFAPLSVGYVGEALASIGISRTGGNFHLSGDRNVSYVDLAVELARQLGVDASLVRPTRSEEKGVSIAFKPQYSGLNMERTTALAGVGPQPLESVVADLVGRFRQ